MSSPLSSNEEHLKSSLLSIMRHFPDFPIKGVNFIDIMPMIGHPTIFAEIIQFYTDYIRLHFPDVSAIAALESRGFLLGAPLAFALHLPLVPLRKPGKLPGPVHTVEYSLEYNKSEKLQCQKDALGSKDRVFIIDDLLATGGTLSAACELVAACGARVRGLGVLLELSNLSGRTRLERLPSSLFALSDGPHNGTNGTTSNGSLQEQLHSPSKTDSETGEVLARLPLHTLLNLSE